MNILITGGSRGIGAACVKTLMDAGHYVIVASRTPANCDKWYECDLTKKYSRSILLDEVKQDIGDIDVLVNNAGMQGHGKFTEIEENDWNRHIDLMLTVPFLLSQQFSKRYKRGHIVNIISTSSFQGARFVAPYVAAKHGLLGLTRSMAIELAPNIHVNAIAPGLIDTDMTKEYISPERRALLESITPAGRFGYGFEVADALLWLINTTYVYGQVITVDGGWLSKNG